MISVVCSFDSLLVAPPGLEPGLLAQRLRRASGKGHQPPNKKRNRNEEAAHEPKGPKRLLFVKPAVEATEVAAQEVATAHDEGA